MRVSVTKRNMLLSAVSLYLGQALYMFYVGARAVSLRTMLFELNSSDHYSITMILGSMSMAVMQPLGGKLGDLFGRKQMFVLGMAGFVLGQVLCAVADSYAVLVIGIIICGAMYGLSWVQQAALIVDIYDRPAQPKVLAGTGIAASVASLLSPVFAGWCVDHAGWRFIFWAMLPFTVLGTFLALGSMPRSTRINTGREIDWVGMLLLSGCIMSLLYVLSMAGKQFPWGSYKAGALLLCSALCLVLLIRQEKKAAAPIVPVSLFKNSTFRLCLFICVVVSVAACGTNYLPTFYQAVLGMTPTRSGFAVAPRQAATILGSLVLGRYISRTDDHRKPCILNGWLLVLSMGMLLLLWPGVPFLMVCLAEVVYGLCTSMGNMLPRSIGQSAFPSRELGMGLAFITFVGTMGTSLGTSLIGCATNIAESLGAVSPLLWGMDTAFALILLSGVVLLIKVVRFQWNKQAVPEPEGEVFGQPVRSVSKQAVPES